MVIKKGTHSPFRLPRLLFGTKKLAYSVKFTDSCRYEIGSDQTDINKLFGIGYFPYHHRNSVRFGWVYNPSKNDTMEIYAYWYKDGKRFSEFLCDVPINGPVYYEMAKEYSTPVGWYFRLRVIFDKKEIGRTAVMVRPQWAGYLLRPYFGGNQTAPHNMEIWMERK
jgi:hypothetical protein